MSALTFESEQILDDLVAAGHFANHSEALEKAVRLLRDETPANGQAKKPDVSAEEWCRRFRAWAESHRPVSHFVDDSRDSIYGGTLDDPR